MRPSWTGLTATGLVLGLLMACAPPARVTPPDPDPPARIPTGGAPKPEAVAVRAWAISRAGDLPAPPTGTGRRPVLEIEQGRISGSTGCNQFNATLAAPGGQAWIEGGIATTRMACTPDLMAFERAVSAALTAAVSLRETASGAELLGRDGRPVMSLSPVSTAPFRQ